MRVEWDPQKALRNEKVHGVSFDEAKELFTTEAFRGGAEWHETMTS